MKRIQQMFSEAVESHGIALVAVGALLATVTIAGIGGLVIAELAAD